MTTDSIIDESLAGIAAEGRRWLLDEVAPLWVFQGIGPNGLFYEALGEGGACTAVPTRLRVQARQIYVFSELGRLGWKGDWHNCVEAGVDHLLTKGRREDGFFIHRFAPDGSPLDVRADLYDHAFVLFALAHASRALGKPNLLKIAEATMDLIEKKWRSPYGGFLEGEVDGPPRRQNPHMHLLEASLALWDVSAKERWRKTVNELAVLSRNRFVDCETGALTEYFLQDWSPSPGAEGRRVEPGHCFEWAWLFEQLIARHIWDEAETSDRLVHFARSAGLDRSIGVAINEVDLARRVENGDAKLWVQTERLKAGVARFHRLRTSSEMQEVSAAFRGLWQYFNLPAKGLWRDMLRADGVFVDKPSAASSLYHIVCALSELDGLSRSLS
jgi:mannose-6-phosphate isomerase